MKNFCQQFFKKTQLTIAVFVGIFAILTFFLNSSYAATATEYGIGRTRTCDAKGNPEGLDFDPTTAGKDVEFVMSNPVCLTVVATTYARVKVAIALMNGTCQTGSMIPRITPSPLRDSYDIGKASIKAATKANSGDWSCASRVTQSLTSWSIALVQLGVIYGIANDTYKNTEICGAGWVNPNTNSYDFNPDSNNGGSGYKNDVQNAVNLYIDSDQSKLTLDNKTYREWYYGGKEVEDNPPEGHTICYDPTSRDSDGDYQRQKYYLRGTLPGNFNCKKYDIAAGQRDPLDNSIVTAARVAELQKAYACCKKRSKEYICIDSHDTKRFCQVGSLCTIEGITFSTKALDNNRFICAQSYSLCPYNFSVGGGSEYCNYYQDGIWNGSSWELISQEDVASGNCAGKSAIRNSDCSYNNKANKCTNYCQYLTHCTKTSDADYQYKSNLGSPYFSNACINFIGDSQNSSSYNGGFILGSQRHFSAPIAQCVKETLENVFYNKAGHSECATTNEYPSSDGTCASGEYERNGDFDYKKGEQVQTTSFFSTIQNGLQDVVKLVLTLSIMFYGMNILIGKADIRNKKDILVYLLKIGLVLYFSTGNAWQGYFFKGVYGASSDFSQMVFKINSFDSESKRDGCQFGYITQSDGTQTSSGRLYPAGKEYLALWDTLDCKIMRYLGFGPEISTANIASLILAGFFTGTIGIYFAIAFMFFGFFFISAAIRALHIFLSSCLSIIIMIFVSPIVIPTVLFQKTSNIFTGWLRELISFSLQPIILFAYIAFFITIMDKTFIGNATFVGNAPSKAISCSKFCRDANGNKVANDESGQLPSCNSSGQQIINPMDSSAACLVSYNNYGEYHAFDLLGITIPILANIFDGNVKQKIITILKCVLVMFLLTQFMDEIPGIAKILIGGSELPQGKTNAIDIYSSVVGVVAAVQKRANQGIAKHGYKAGEQLAKSVRSGFSSGKSASENRSDKQSDSTTKSNNSPDSTETSQNNSDSPDKS